MIRKIAHMRREQMREQRTCLTCNGKGTKIDRIDGRDKLTTCRTCKGSGKV
jgi:DnaJ-class molecular chaperone